MTDTPPPPAPDPAAPNPYAAPASPAPAAGSKGLSITSLILGILGFIGAWIFGSGLLFSIAAVITGHIGLKKEPSGRPLSITGLVLGYIGIAIAVIVLIVVIIGFAVAGSVFSSLMEICNQYGPGEHVIDGVTYTCS